MEDFGNIAVLVFFLLVGVVSSLAKALSDYRAKSVEKETARKVADRIRQAAREKDQDGAGQAAAQGRPGTIEEIEHHGSGEDIGRKQPQEPVWMDEDADEAPQEPVAAQLAAMPQIRGLDAAPLPSDRQPRTSPDFKPEEAGVPLSQAPAMTNRPKLKESTGPKFHVRSLGRRSLREAFVLSEVLSPPISLRK